MDKHFGTKWAKRLIVSALAALGMLVAVGVGSNGVNAATTPAANADQISFKAVLLNSDHGVITTIKPTDVINQSGVKVKTLKAMTDWKVNDRVEINQKPYYDLGGGQFIYALDVIPYATVIPFKMVCQVRYIPGYGIQVWNDQLKPVSQNGKSKRLKHGTNWKVFGLAFLKGHTYYSLGGNQFLDARYMVRIK
ncbi:SLAP domain-containing protein [Lacticaseibacillus pabuli]|uniref:SLAP domain-containing protein n=1 Tax=Lacticaseibacillus pabuli TaxID=3025672 RepID=A0ABY7WTW5_9LACO|nr:SLAP domain-containing protein [Lacticaseibacillus sp. KACC 23028]WDF82431.1 SLAP domain-containing protein [Lacticaseibacillus sp. KACC 23028]